MSDITDYYFQKIWDWADENNKNITNLEEFTEIYIVDLGGNVRKGDKDENVFNIMVGVAIMFLVKRDSKDECKLFYLKNPEIKKADKLKWLRNNKTYLNFKYYIWYSHIL